MQPQSQLQSVHAIVVKIEARKGDLDRLLLDINQTKQTITSLIEGLGKLEQLADSISSQEIDQSPQELELEKQIKILEENIAAADEKRKHLMKDFQEKINKSVNLNNLLEDKGSQKSKVKDELARVESEIMTLESKIKNFDAQL